MTLRTLGLNLQILLVIVVTAVSISVVDNVIDAQRIDEASERGSVERETQFNATKQEQMKIQEAQERHANITETTLIELKRFITNELQRDNDTSTTATSS